MVKRKRQTTVMISVVAERFDIHPQTLRLYEREGLIDPPRSDGNTRLYDDDTLKRLETVLTLTRDMGVNLAGVDVILKLQARIDQLEAEVERMSEFVRQEMGDRRAGVDRRHALVEIDAGPLVRR